MWRIGGGLEKARAALGRAEGVVANANQIVATAHRARHARSVTLCPHTHDEPTFRVASLDDPAFCQNGDLIGMLDRR